MIHRDLKIDNIMLDSIQNVKLIDFGLVSINECLFTNYSLNSHSMTKGIGTLSFMSPEMLNEEDYDFKTDIYSFGVVLYFIFVGNLPKYSLKDKMSGKPIQLPKASNSISQFCISLISKCLQYNPKYHPSFEDILEEIRNNSYSLASGIDTCKISKRVNYLESFKK